MSKIVLSHIDKFYGENHVLRDINLTIEDGDFMTLLGPSGCGKTTTLRVVSGLEKPQHGTMTIDGRSIIDADKAFYEEPKNRESDRVLIVDKNKDGEIGHIFLKFVGDKMRFYYREDAASPASSKQNKEPDYKNHTFFDLDEEEEGEIPF